MVGAGAAGLATAIFAARAAPRLHVRCLDGARRVGAKILVSGGSRCNVTNREVTERDFWGGPSRIVRNVLRAFPAARAAAFFEELGVRLHEEEDGKLFPDTNRSRTVLDALLDEATRLGIRIDTAHRVTAIHRREERFELSIASASDETLSSRAVVIATGGRSLPKTGSDGLGYDLVGGLGHGCIDTTPALAPLVLNGERHAALAGVSHEAALSLRVDGRIAVRLEGSLLWTHFGMSGPVVLNMSRHWHRAALDGAGVEVIANLCPGETFESLDEWWLDQERDRPRAQASTVLSTRVPAAIADAWLTAAGIDRDTTMAHVGREERRRLVHALVEGPVDRARQPRVWARRSHGWRHPARRDRSGDDAVARVSWAVSGGRNPRRGRSAWAASTFSGRGHQAGSRGTPWRRHYRDDTGVVADTARGPAPA